MLTSLTGVSKRLMWLLQLLHLKLDTKERKIYYDFDDCFGIRLDGGESLAEEILADNHIC